MVPAQIDGDPAGFRPFSFLTSLAERVGELTSGDGTGRGRDGTHATATRATPSGRGSSWRATCAARGRSSSSRR